MSKHSKVSRRSFIKAAGVGAAGLGAGLILPTHARAQKKKTLKILQWNHFVPGFDKWFNGTYIKQWGDKNDTEVTVDNVDVKAVNARAASEVSAQQGHDLFLFLAPPAAFEDQVIDHKEIYQECEKRYGPKPIHPAAKTTYNPKTNKYFTFTHTFVAAPINNRSLPC